MQSQLGTAILAGVLTTAVAGTHFLSLSNQPAAASEPPSSSSTGYVLLPRGSWSGTFQTGGSYGQVQLFIDTQGRLYGSLESADGDNFAQIRGQVRGSQAHMTFTPPPGISNQLGSPYSQTFYGKTSWQGKDTLIINIGSDMRFQTYTLHRLSETIGPFTQFNQEQK